MSALGEAADDAPADEALDGLRGLAPADGDRLELDAVIARDELKSMLFGSRRAHERIGRYRVLGTLGVGGMGVVLKARDDQLARTVALKLVRGAVAEGPEARARILREARAMARLSHPNVVQVHDVGEVHEQVFVAMEYVRGQTLREWLAELDPGLDPARRWRAVLEPFLAAGRGLAAAHAVGLVHRDFKPDNVLVGRDGRVRVTDFGLARTSDGDPSISISTASIASILVDSMTRTGALLGTVAYMAPEQLLGEGADARSDLFAFCVALYEGLYGVRPFQGASARELHRAMIEGAMDPGEGAAVPAWLRAAIVRGLAIDPKERPPTMDALLAALMDDPEVAARRRRRLIVLAALALLGAILLAWLGDTARVRWRHHRTEADATRAIDGIEGRLVGLRERGEDALATRLFDELMGDPALTGTEALADAWLREGDRRAALRSSSGAAAEGEAALTAYARAYIAAQSEHQEVAALVGLAAALHAGRRWEALARLLDRLERRHPEALADPSLAAVRFDAAMVTRELSVAASLVDELHPEGAALIRALSRGASLGSGPITPLVASVTLGERGPPAYVLERPDGEGLAIEVHRGDLLGAPIARSRTLIHYGDVGRYGRPLPYLLHRVDGGTSALLRVEESGEFVELARWEGGGPMSAAAADLDGDGALEIYVGEAASKDIVQVAADADGVWRARSVGRGVTMNSDVNILNAVDLDGDGAVELVAGLGPWTAYDVRVLGLDDAVAAGEGPRLRTRARVKLGNIKGVEALQRPHGEVVLVVAKDDEYANTTVFPADRPEGEPRGLYLYRFEGERLGLVTAIRGRGSREPWVIAVADVDGDGREDILEGGGEDGFGSVVVHLQGPEGELRPYTLGHASFVGVVPGADGGPARIILALQRRAQLGVAEEMDFWLTGGGEAPIPALISEHVRAATPGLADAALRERAESTEVLADFGLVAEAARSYDQIADLADDPAERAALSLRSAILHELAGDEPAATARFVAAAGDPSRASEAIEGALRGVMTPPQREAARQAIDGVLASLPADAEARARLVGLQGRLVGRVDGGATLEEDFAAPLRPGWSIDEPLALRRRDGALEIESFAAATLLSLPVELVDEAIELELELRIDRMEWSAGLALELVAEGAAPGPPLVELLASASGGGGVVRSTLQVKVSGAGHGWVSREAALGLESGEPLELLLGCTIAPAVDERRCTARDQHAARVVWRGTIERPPTPGPHRLVLRSYGEVGAALVASLRAIRASGVRARAAADEPPGRRYGAALVEGAPAEALALLDDPKDMSESAAWARVELLLRLGRVEAALAELRPLLDRVGDGEPPPALIAGLRRAPDLWRPALLALGAGRYYALVLRAWYLGRVMHAEDRRIDAELEGALVDLDRHVAQLRAEPTADDDALETAAELLHWRASLRARQGAEVGAREDLEVAIALLRRPSGAPGVDRRRAGQALWILLDLAEAEERAGAPERARARLGEARASANQELVDDLIAARPRLRAIEGSTAIGE